MKVYGMKGKTIKIRCFFCSVQFLSQAALYETRLVFTFSELVLFLPPFCDYQIHQNTVQLRSYFIEKVAAPV
jgi:hypothetical protein